VAKCKACGGVGLVLEDEYAPISSKCKPCNGTGEVTNWEELAVSAASGDWGALPAEPCRFCRQAGGVHFLIDDGPEGRKGLSPVRCDQCGWIWVPGESSA
jgi:RecJ-like exonuclease